MNATRLAGREPGSLRRHRFAFLVVVAIGGVLFVGGWNDSRAVAAAGRSEPPDVEIETLTVRQRATGMTMLDGVIVDIQDACEGADIVKTAVKLPTGGFSIRTDCRDPDDVATERIEQRLVRRAGRFNDAVAKATVVEKLENALRSELAYEGSPRRASHLIWSIAVGNPETCRRATDRDQIEQSMAAVVSEETPERWTLIEAVLLAGACPNRLDDLRENVAALGHPGAAQAVRTMIDKAME